MRDNAKPPLRRVTPQPGKHRTTKRYPTPKPRPAVYFYDPQFDTQDITISKIFHFIVQKILWIFDNLMLKNYRKELVH
uniref:Uncharacterized protein n=1 Tax=Trichobilharzia regenti TaxID=157069 RepID=A0AA85J6Q1_TRIRE|nr:unnamed protein product [Trichobilharzia regenti]